jgi:regulator of RNase E activity RraA
MIIVTSLTIHAQETYTDEEILNWYQELRVADVSDGMDMAGLADIGLMDNIMMALWKDMERFDHVIRGIAVTARYVPTNRPRPLFTDDDAFRAWEGNWYGTISPEPFLEHLKKGSILVIDANGDGDTGSIGSNNSLLWKSRGMVGIVTTGSLRDSDEVIKQKIPVYMDPQQRGRGIRPGRNEIESVQKTIQVAGVQINPGDVVIADGDGVIVVPRAYAKRVAEAAAVILEKDKGSRRSLYIQLGMPLDFTVEE